MEKAHKKRKTRETKKKNLQNYVYDTVVPLSQTFNTAANTPEFAKGLQGHTKTKQLKKKRQKSLEFFLLTFPSTFPYVMHAPREKRQLQHRPAAAAPSSSYTLGSPTRFWHLSSYPELPRRSTTRAVQIAHLGDTKTTGFPC